MFFFWRGGGVALFKYLVVSLFVFFVVVVFLFCICFSCFI